MALTEQQIVALRRWAEAVAHISPYQQERIVIMCEELLIVRAERDALRATLNELWTWAEPKVDWASLRYAPHPDPKKAPHYAYDPRHKAIWDMRKRVEDALAATPTPDGRRDAGTQEP